MYSPTRKVRASLRRTIALIILSCLGTLVLIGTIIEFDLNIDNQYLPTRSAGEMLNYTQMLLANEILLQPKSFSCSSNTYPLYIIVKTRAISSGNFFQRRMFTRTSWGREAHSYGIPVIYAIGRAKDEKTQQMLEDESKIYDDILQFNYIDAYYNNSIKTFGILNWFLNNNCHQSSPYLFIVDDDILLNLPLLMKMISKNSFQLNTLYGLYLKDIEPHPSGKWAVSLNDYPNKTYPEFITGASTLYPSIILNKIVKKLFQMIKEKKKFLFLDDVLINGIISEELNIKRSSMFGIEDCSYTDLQKRIIISECNNIRRIYVWSKFIFSRIKQNTDEIDRLINTTTTYIKWKGNFKQTRNGTSINSTDINEKFNNSKKFIRTNLILILCIMISGILFIFILKIIIYYQQLSKINSII